MRFVLLQEDQKTIYREEILSMMRFSDKDFIPPLSARSSTTQKDLSGSQSTENGIELYYAQMETQQILCAFEEDTLLGFVSYRENHTSDLITEESFPNIYLSTLIVKPEARGKGLTRKMYEYLFWDRYRDRNIFTRTWSTNFAHIKILDRFGFDLIHRIENDRGKGIDTVYFRKRPE